MRLGRDFIKTRLLVHKHIAILEYIFDCIFLLPPANVVCKGYVFTGVCVFTGGVLSQHALQVVSQHALQQVSGGWYPSMPCRFPGHTWGGSWGDLAGGSPGPNPRGKLRGIWPGGSLQAHTQGGS